VKLFARRWLVPCIVGLLVVVAIFNIMSVYSPNLVAYRPIRWLISAVGILAALLTQRWLRARFSREGDSSKVPPPAPD
jgi:O-antigen/teichoic acid export membrane protein